MRKWATMIMVQNHIYRICFFFWINIYRICYVNIVGNIYLLFIKTLMPLYYVRLQTKSLFYDINRKKMNKFIWFAWTPYVCEHSWVELNEYCLIYACTYIIPYFELWRLNYESFYLHIFVYMYDFFRVHVHKY